VVVERPASPATAPTVPAARSAAAKAATMVCRVSISGSSPACCVISGRSHRNDSIPAGHGYGVIEGRLVLVACPATVVAALTRDWQLPIAFRS